MKKEIIIYECDNCGIDLIKRHDCIYFLIEKDMPGWVSYSYGEKEGMILCERCMKKVFPKYISKTIDPLKSND